MDDWRFAAADAMLVSLLPMAVVLADDKWWLASWLSCLLTCERTVSQQQQLRALFSLRAEPAFAVYR